MISDGSYVVLSTGKQKYAYSGIFGLDWESPSEWNITYGSDGGFYSSVTFYQEDHLEEKLAKEELLEVIDNTITRWQNLKQVVLEREEI